MTIRDKNYLRFKIPTQFVLNQSFPTFRKLLQIISEHLSHEPTIVANGLEQDGSNGDILGYSND